MLNLFDIIVEHIVKADDIYGKPAPLLKVKMVKKTHAAKLIVVNALPINIKEEHRGVTLSMDILFVNRIPFIVCKSESIEHINAHRLRNRGKKCIAKAL